MIWNEIFPAIEKSLEVRNDPEWNILSHWKKFRSEKWSGMKYSQVWKKTRMMWEANHPLLEKLDPWMISRICLPFTPSKAEIWLRYFSPGAKGSLHIVLRKFFMQNEKENKFKKYWASEWYWNVIMLLSHLSE
jgi:hypothetical protein